MQALTLTVLAAIAGVSGYLIKVPTAPVSQPTFAPSGWIHLQKLVLPLFENVCEESSNPTICRLSEEFASNPSAGDFWDAAAISQFQTLKSGKGFLPRGEIFSDYNDTHVEELKVMFNVLRNAKNFDTFYKAAAWARQNLNCGLYVNLIYLAFENRKDTERLILPPPYELLPNYFIRKDIIIQGSSLLAGEEFTPSEGVRDEGNAYTLDANYTANFYNNDDESKLAYFREDIGLNSHYFLKRLKYALYLNENIDVNSRHGEELYHMIKQLVARYNLERYSNGMPEQDSISWDSLSDAPYDPMLVYSNGNEFIHRTSSVQLPENEDKALLLTIENNIATVASHMRDSGYNKTQILNHLMEILVTGERSYDALARHLLGKALSNNGKPTIYDHYMTSLRDPMIWRLYKKIVDLVDNALKVLPPYTKSELYFPGVEVVNIDVKKMMTNFDYFEFDITEALKIGNGDTTFQVKIGQPRLNHKPFMMKVNISSLVTQKGLVKIYLGPKVMPGEFAKKKNLFGLLDCFEVNLKRGSNIVTRTSNDMKQLAPDFISFQTLRKKVEDAQFGLDSLPVTTIDSQINFPERLTIPKGTPEGLPLQLFVFVAPYMKSLVSGAYSVSNMEFNSAVMSSPYPLDLIMEERILLDLPNALIKDIVVTHKGISKVSNYGGSGATKSWYDNSYSGPPPKSRNYGNENEPFDYNSRKGQFARGDTTQSQYFGNQESNYDETIQNDNPTLSLKQDLTTSENSYSYTRPEPFDYKSKRVDYKSLHKNQLTEKPMDTKMDDGITENIILKENPTTLKHEEADSPYMDPKDQSSEYISEEQNNDATVRMKHNLLKSTSYDYLSKRKGSFDYKSIRPKYEKPDYKALYKNLRKTTGKPLEFDQTSKNKVEKGSVINKNDILQKHDEAELENGTIENTDIFKRYKDHNNFESTTLPSSNKYVEMFIEDVKDINSEEYIGLFKENGSEELFKVIPIQTPTSSKENDSTIYKYIRRIIHDNINDDEIETTVVPS